LKIVCFSKKPIRTKLFDSRCRCIKYCSYLCTYFLFVVIVNYKTDSRVCNMYTFSRTLSGERPQRRTELTCRHTTVPAITRSSTEQKLYPLRILKSPPSPQPEFHEFIASQYSSPPSSSTPHPISFTYWYPTRSPLVVLYTPVRILR